MKNSICKKSVKFVLSTLVCFFSFSQTVWAQQKINSTRIASVLTNTTGIKLSPGKMYIVKGNMEINAGNGNGINVGKTHNGQQAPILFIPENVTLTVKGASAPNAINEGTGICIPKDAELIITGAGKLIATGGKNEKGTGIGGAASPKVAMGKVNIMGSVDITANIANSGSIYVGPNATINGSKGAVPSNLKDIKTVQSAPNDMQVTLTFRNNELNEDGSKAEDVKVGSIACTIGDPLPNAPISPYLLTAIDKLDKSDKYFAGYYGEDNSIDNRIYKGIANDNNLAPAVKAVPYSQDHNIYAHFVHVHHIINWDYTYSNGVDSTTSKSTWLNLNETEYLKHGKLVFYGPKKANGKRSVIKESVIEAFYKNMDNTSSDCNTGNFHFFHKPKAGAEFHTRAVGNIYLRVGSGKDKLNTMEDVDIHFTDDQLAQFCDYDFIPWEFADELDQRGSKPTHWQTIIDREYHQTVFSFTGVKEDDQFTLRWAITLTGLKKFPDQIYVKPLFLDKDEDWVLISQLPVRYDGISCQITAFDDNDDPNLSSATYSGEYPVWNKNALTKKRIRV